MKMLHQNTNLTKARRGTHGVVVSFMRGLDLSGSIQGAGSAGSVGGVLAVKAGSSAQCSAMANTTHFTCYDGNGNVTALVNTADSSESARYEYSPFGEPLRATGPLARLNPIRFSTQYADDVTDDTKYLHRDYQADAGRWPNRDPIGERGGLNLYAFAENNPVNWIDPLGQSACGDWKKSKDLVDWLRCCTEQFSKKACIPSLRGPGYMARFNACRSACMLTDGEQGPNLPQPGKPKDSTENPNPKIPDISIPDPPKK